VKTVNVERSVKTQADLFIVGIVAGRLVLVNGPDGQVSLRGKATYQGSRAPTLEWPSSAKDLSLVSSCPPVDRECGYDYTLTVPVAINIVATIAAGNISVHGADGPAELSAGAGDVSGSDLGSAAVQVTDRSGNVSLLFNAAPASVDVRVSIGNVVLAVPRSAQYHIVTSDLLGTVMRGIPNSVASERLISLRVGTGDISLTWSH